MEHIVPRWEWRTFGHQFGAAETKIAALPAEKAQQSSETYLLASNSGANAKIRDGLLDIKLLERVDSAGLQQWRPVSKDRFPLNAAAVACVKTALSLPETTAIAEGISLEQFLDVLTKAGKAVHIANVTKSRVRYTVQGCSSEITEVVVDGKKVRTIAIEDADPAKVIAAVRALGLEGYENTGYPRGLKRAIGQRGETESPVRRAVIDVGTNSVKFHIAERDAKGVWTTVLDRADVTRLGEGIDKIGSIAPAAMDRTATAIARMKDEAISTAVAGITAVGTMGLRKAGNSREFLELVKQRCGIPIEVISGEEEARLAYVAVRSGIGLAEGSLVIFDSGGGSSQFTFGHGNEIDKQFSVEVGAVRYTERFGLSQAVSPEVLEQAKSAIADDLHSLDGASTPDVLVGMGGAVTNIAAVMHRLSKYDPEVIQGSVIDRAEIDRQIEQYRAIPAEARRQIVGLQPKRAEVILAGACIVRTVLEKLKCSSLTVSDRGLRHGLLLDRFGGTAAGSAGAS